MRKNPIIKLFPKFRIFGTSNFCLFEFLKIQTLFAIFTCISIIFSSCLSNEGFEMFGQKLFTADFRGTTLTAGVWADGTSGEQWFRFTATAPEHYIHASFGTLSGLSVQLYDSDRNATGYAADLSVNDRYVLRNVTRGRDYYIKVKPNGRGSFRIAFNASSAAPLPPFIKNYSAVTALVPGAWADGSPWRHTLGGEHWYRFTATADTQYIHVDFDEANPYGLYVQLYNLYSGVGSQTWINGRNRRVSHNVTRGGEYYIKVTPYGDLQAGAYRISFNSSNTAPSPTVALVPGVWEDGEIAPEGEQWFKFTASASSHYIYACFGALSGLSVRLYDRSGNEAGDGANLSGNNRYFLQNVTNRQPYYIRVKSNGGSGTYRIAYNAAEVPLPPPPDNGGPVTALTPGACADGNKISDGEQWFGFTATAAEQYIHASFDMMNSSGGLRVQVYDSSGDFTGSAAQLNSGVTCISYNVTPGREYYIRVNPYNSSSGTYRIAFKTSAAPLLPSASATATAIRADTWTWTNDIVLNGEQWFKFTAIASEQYVHVVFGTLTSLYFQLYNAVGDAAGGRTLLNGGSAGVSRNVTRGLEYYIKVTPYSGGSGTYRIAFNTSSTPPQ
jgi:hypothetical protein